MNELKVGFSSMTHRQVADLANRVHHSLTHPPGSDYFPSTDPAPPVIRTALDALEFALGKETSVSTAALRKGRRDELVEQLLRLSVDLELTAKGDIIKLSATGFDLKGRPGMRSEGPLPAPGNVRMSVTGITGEALMKCRAIPNAANYQPEHALHPEGPWIRIDLSSSSQKILFKGLARGKDYYFRVRANGTNGPGAWSDIATMMVV